MVTTKVMVLSHTDAGYLWAMCLVYYGIFLKFYLKCYVTQHHPMGSPMIATVYRVTAITVSYIFNLSVYVTWVGLLDTDILQCTSNTVTFLTNKITSWWQLLGTKYDYL